MVDYSKWKNIDISDDEDDTHPNIDTPSLFRWRHQARLERMAELQHEREQITLKRQSYKARKMDIEERLKKGEGDKAALEKEKAEIEKEGKEIDRKEEELIKKEKKTPWNVDTISKPGFEKTVLNKQAIRKPEENLTEEEREARMKKFIKENEKLCKQYGMLRKYDDSRRFLQEHSHLVCEETANYLVVWSINLEMEEKHDLMAHVAHQCICMQYILELAKQLDVDPRSCVGSFFSKIQNCIPEYREQFESEIEGLKGRISKRAQERLKEALEEAQKEEEEEYTPAPLGPGGLDPTEVFEELPDELKKCFETRDIELLQKTIAAMPVDVARYHMKRCVDSGLWVPNADDEEQQQMAKGGDKTATAPDAEKSKKPTSDSPTKAQTQKQEPIYTGVSTDDVD